MCYFWLVICDLAKKVPSTKTYRLVSQSTVPVTGTSLGPQFVPERSCLIFDHA